MRSSWGWPKLLRETDSKVIISDSLKFDNNDTDALAAILSSKAMRYRGGREGVGGGCGERGRYSKQSMLRDFYRFTNVLAYVRSVPVSLYI